VHLRAAGAAERLPPVVRDRQVPARKVDPLVVLRVDGDAREVERAEVDRAGALPGLAAVVAPEQAAADRVVVHDRPAGAAEVALDHGVHDARVLRIDREADPPGARRESVRLLLPGLAAVVRPEDAARFADAAERPGGAPARVHPGVHRVGVLRVDDDVAGAGVRVDLQDLPPGLPAVARRVHAAFRVRSPQAPQRRDVEDVRVAGIDGEARDVARVLQADVRPGPPGVGRAVDAVPPRRRVAPVPLAGPDPDDLPLAALGPTLLRGAGLRGRAPRGSGGPRLPGRVRLLLLRPSGPGL